MLPCVYIDRKLYTDYYVLHSLTNCSPNLTVGVCLLMGIHFRRARRRRRDELGPLQQKQLGHVKEKTRISRGRFALLFH